MVGKKKKLLNEDLWDIKLGPDGQPIMPKQVICVTNLISDIEPKYAHLGVLDYTVGQVYDVIPYPHKLNDGEIKSLLGPNGLLFVKYGNFPAYVNKRYFKPI